MNCGCALTGQPTTAARRRAAVAPPRQTGADWAKIAAAALAFFSLRHTSRKAQQTAIVITFLALFFGCPMACAFVMYVLDWFARLFQ